MCFQGDGMSRKPGFMDMMLYKKIIDESKRYVDRVNLYIAGEPLLHPKIIEMISYAKKFSLKVRIHTNATLMDEELCDGLIRSELDILSMSFDAISSSYYENTRVGARFNKTLENITYLLELKRSQNKKKPYTIIEIIQNAQIESKIDSFIKKYNYLPVNKFNVVNCHSWTGSVFPKQRIKEKIPACSYLWNSLSILWDGSVVPCCLDYDAKYKLGSITQESLESIWNNKKMLHLRELHIQHRRGNIPLCKNCDKMEF